MGRIPNIPLGQHWKPDEEHYDTQKLNGLTLPRTIRASSWTQLKDIEGCDHLTVPVSKLFTKEVRMSGFVNLLQDVKYMWQPWEK